MWVFHFWGHNTPSKQINLAAFRARARARVGVRFVPLPSPRPDPPPLDFHCLREGGDSVKTTRKNDTKRPIIATRKSCSPNGTGLSHYVMLDAKK